MTLSRIIGPDQIPVTPADPLEETFHTKVNGLDPVDQNTVPRFSMTVSGAFAPSTSEHKVPYHPSQSANRIISGMGPIRPEAVS